MMIDLLVGMWFLSVSVYVCLFKGFEYACLKSVILLEDDLMLLFGCKVIVEFLFLFVFGGLDFW